MKLRKSDLDKLLPAAALAFGEGLDSSKRPAETSVDGSGFAFIAATTSIAT